jgi:hypothetical protein
LLFPRVQGISCIRMHSRVTIVLHFDEIRVVNDTNMRKHAGLPTVVRVERISEPSPVSYTYNNKWSKSKFSVATSGAE